MHSQLASSFTDSPRGEASKEIGPGRFNGSRTAELLAITFAVIEVVWAASFSIHEAQLTTGHSSRQGPVTANLCEAWVSARSLLGTADDQTLEDLVTERITTREWTSVDEARGLLDSLVSV